MFVYRPRRKVNGETIIQKYYRGRYKSVNSNKWKDITLGKITHKDVAYSRLLEIVKSEQLKSAGLLIENENAKILPLLDKFLLSKKVRYKGDKYLKQVKGIINRIALFNKWNFVSDINEKDFKKWLDNQFLTKSAKTLKEYTITINSFCSWLLKNKYIKTNPILVEPIDTRGRETRIRRALSIEEAKSLLSISKERMPLYLTAISTGLRRSELLSLLWSDVNIKDLKNAYLKVRASTTKNKKSAVIPLTYENAKVLKELSLNGYSIEHYVFPRLNKLKEFKQDLEKAKIPYKDKAGRVLDFHSLRYTFSVNLANSGALERQTMELMRHSDPRLTSKVYTDTGKLCNREAVNKLPSLTDYTQIHTHKTVQSSLPLSSKRNDSLLIKEENKDIFEAICLKLSSEVINSSQKQKWLRQLDSNQRPSG